MKRQNWRKMCAQRGHKFDPGQPIACQRCRGQSSGFKRWRQHTDTDLQVSGGEIVASQGLIIMPLTVGMFIPAVSTERGRSILVDL